MNMLKVKVERPRNCGECKSNPAPEEQDSEIETETEEGEAENESV